MQTRLGVAVQTRRILAFALSNSNSTPKMFVFAKLTINPNENSKAFSKVIQSTLVMSTSLISYNRLSRSETSPCFNMEI